MDSDRDHIDEGLAERLRAFGHRPVDPAIRSAHLTSIAEISTPRRRWSSPLRVGAAAVVGFLVGTTGLAGAGALGPLQPAASDALEKVGINVPEGSDVGTKRIRSAECTALAGGDDYKNHGQFLKAVRENDGDLEAAKALDCGKPVASLEEELGDAGVEDSTVDDAPDSERGKGRPDSPGASESKGRAPEGAGTTAECAGGADNATPVDGAEVAASVPPDSPPGMPDCAADQKPDDPGAAADATAEQRGGDVGSERPPASSKAPANADDIADDIADDKAKDTPAADKFAPEAGETSSAEDS